MQTSYTSASTKEVEVKVLGGFRLVDSYIQMTAIMVGIIWLTIIFGSGFLVNKNVSMKDFLSKIRNRLRKSKENKKKRKKVETDYFC